MADVTFEGMDELLTKVQELGATAGRLENQAVQAGAKVVQTNISRRAPRSTQPRQPKESAPSQSWRTGQHAADNIKISKVLKRNGVKTVQVGIQKGDNSHYFYLKFHEWGTSKMQAQPFMGPAAEESKSEVMDTMKSVLRAGLGL